MKKFDTVDSEFIDDNYFENDFNPIDDSDFFDTDSYNEKYDQKNYTNKYRRQKRRKKKRLGFTNKMAISIIVIIVIGLLLGYDLAVKSIYMQYMGALACFTAAFAPIGTACSIVLAKVVDKNKSENTGADGTGITFATAQANNFKPESNEVDETFDNSPAI